MNQIEKLMTTKEVANILNCATNTVRENAKKCLPNKIFVNGKPTFWNEKEVTILLDFMKDNQTKRKELKENLSKTSTGLTPALKIKQAMELMQVAYEEEVANLKARNIEVIQENNVLRLEVKQLNHAIEYDKVCDWKVWNIFKKQLGYKGNFKNLAEKISLIEGEDFERKVMGYDNYKTILISPSGEEKIIDYKENVLDEAI